jgi:hypothetical protein
LRQRSDVEPCGAYLRAVDRPGQVINGFFIFIKEFLIVQ